MKHRWVERAAAWDAYKDSRQLVVQEASLQEAVAHLTEKTSLRLAAIDAVIDQKISALIAQGAEASSTELKAVLLSLERSLRLSRLNMGLPTAYRIESADEPSHEDDVFYIG